MAQFSKFGCITLLFNLFQLCNKSLFRRDGLIGIRGEFYVINQCALRFGWEKSNQRFAQSCRVGRLAGADGAGGKPCVFCDIFIKINHIGAVQYAKKGSLVVFFSQPGEMNDTLLNEALIVSILHPERKSLDPQAVFFIIVFNRADVVQLQ